MGAPGGVHAGVALRLETPLLGDVGDKAQRIAELAAGMRCVGCGERITLGFRFTQFKPVDRDGRTQVDTVVTQACSLPGCAYAQEVAPHAHVMEMIEFAWLDEGHRSGDGRLSPLARRETRQAVGKRKRQMRERAARAR